LLSPLYYSEAWYDCILLGIVAALLFQNITIWSRQGLLQPTHHPRDLLRTRQFPASQLTPQTITVWMPFSYLNKVFNLPSDYLKNKLSISDPKYPNITIRKYSQTYQLNSVLFLEQVKKIIEEYQVTSSTPAST
jgi:hypothetical protein